MERKISAEEATILSCDRPKHGSSLHLFETFRDCPKCVYWLAEEVSQNNEKTCRKCISPFRNEQQTIPYSPTNGEYKSLNNGGGSDNRSGRESYDIVKSWDNIESNSPLNRCSARCREEAYYDCEFSSCGCNFRATDLNQLKTHNEQNIHRHMTMMSSQITQNGKDVKTSLHALNKNEPENCHQNGLDVSSTSSTSSNLLETKKLHDRIASLEQELCDYKLDVKRLTMIINKISISNLRDRSGTLVWQIDEFKKKFQTMLNNPNTMYYSPDFYTDPNGYRFCARISMSSKSKVKDSLSFHVHMMQSENDFHLDWPFRGCIQIFMIHEDSKLTQRDKIMTNEKSTAFQRPNSEISAHSFGFTEYAIVSSIIKDGFLSSDGKLTIKLHIGIV